MAFNICVLPHETHDYYLSLMRGDQPL